VRRIAFCGGHVFDCGTLAADHGVVRDNGPAFTWHAVGYSLLPPKNDFMRFEIEGLAAAGGTAVVGSELSDVVVYSAGGAALARGDAPLLLDAFVFEFATEPLRAGNWLRAAFAIPPESGARFVELRPGGGADASPTTRSEITRSSINCSPGARPSCADRRSLARLEVGAANSESPRETFACDDAFRGRLVGAAAAETSGGVAVVPLRQNSHPRFAGAGWGVVDSKRAP
jgi:hypothetical protein